MEKTNIYDILLEKNREKLIRIAKVEKDSNQIVFLFVLNVIILFFINYYTKVLNINITISFNFFYCIIFFIIFNITFIYGIVKRKIVINIIFYIKLFLLLNLLFLISASIYIYYLHLVIPYIPLLKIFNLIEIKHFISFEFCLECAREYCLLHQYIIPDNDIIRICNISTDFDIVQRKLDLYNQFLEREIIRLEKEKRDQYTLLNILKNTTPYLVNTFNFIMLLVSYSHTDLIACNPLDMLVIIFLGEGFPEGVDNDYSGLFYFLYPERDEVCDFITGII